MVRVVFLRNRTLAYNARVKMTYAYIRYSRPTSATYASRFMEKIFYLLKTVQKFEAASEKIFIMASRSNEC